VPVLSIHEYDYINTEKRACQLPIANAQGSVNVDKTVFCTSERREESSETYEHRGVLRCFAVLNMTKMDVDGARQARLRITVPVNAGYGVQ
jgi:hypothetical protein